MSKLLNYKLKTMRSFNVIIEKDSKIKATLTDTLNNKIVSSSTYQSITAARETLKEDIFREIIRRKTT